MKSASNFYAAGAQIVPLLYIALAVEMRFFAWRKHHLRLPQPMWLFPIVLSFLFIFAETACLAPLLFEQDTGVTRTLSALGLSFTAGIVLMLPVATWHLEGADRAVERNQTALAERLDRRAMTFGLDEGHSHGRWVCGGNVTEMRHGSIGRRVRGLPGFRLT